MRLAPSARVMLLVVAVAMLAPRAVETVPVTEEVVPTELGKDNFTSYLSSLPPQRMVMMEFYAHW